MVAGRRLRELCITKKRNDLLPRKGTRPEVATYQYLPIDQSQLGRNCLCLPIGRTQVTIRLVIVNRPTKMVHSEPVQIPIDAPRLPDSIVSD